MNDWIKDIRYLILPSGHPLKGYEKEYAAAYDCWRSAWSKFRTEVGVNDMLYSDGFILPHEMGVLFYKEECVGLACFSYGLMSDPSVRHHSYFKGWTDLALRKLQQISDEVVLCSQFTVNPDFTGKNQIVRWKEIVSLLTLMRFEHSISGVMAGQLNLSRKMNEAAGQAFGATVLEQELPYLYGDSVKVQLVAYHREGIEQMKTEKGLHNFCETLWSKMKNLSEFPVTDDKLKSLKKAA